MVAVRFIFDVDGVILDSIPAYQKAWAAWAKEYCVDEEAIWAVAHGRRPADIIRSVAGRLDATASLKRFENLIQVEYETVEAHDGARDLLTTLPRPSWTLASSGDQALVEAAFRRLQLPVPHRGVYGADIRVGKPDPSCFLLAAEHLKAPPADCVVVEDSASGVAAGKAAGMTVIAVTTTHTAEDLHQADSIHSGLAEAAEFIYALSAREDGPGHNQGTYLAGVAAGYRIVADCPPQITDDHEAIASTPATTPRSASRRCLNDRATTGPAHPGA